MNVLKRVLSDAVAPIVTDTSVMMLSAYIAMIIPMRKQALHILG